MNKIDPAGLTTITWPCVVISVITIPVIVNPATVGIAVGAAIILWPSSTAGPEDDMIPSPPYDPDDLIPTVEVPSEPMPKPDLSNTPESYRIKYEALIFSINAII